MRNHIDGLIFSLTILLFYLVFSFLVVTFFASSLFALPYQGGLNNEMIWVHRYQLSLIIVFGVIPLLLCFIHNVFFVLFFKKLWLKHLTKMKRWQVTVICWGPFLCPGLLHIAVASVPAWKCGARRAKWLFLLISLLFLFWIGPLLKLLSWTIYSNITFYGGIVFFVLLFAFYRSVSCDVLSRWTKWSSAILCFLIVPMIAWIYGLTVLADARYTSSLNELARANIPASRAQFYQYFYDGTKVNDNTRRWASLMKNLPYLPTDLPLPNVLMTPELRVERDNYLKNVDSVMDEINQLVIYKIKPDVDQTKAINSLILLSLSRERFLGRIYFMRMQFALDGEYPNIKSALSDFRRSRELLKFGEFGVAYGIERTRLEALGEVYARANLSADDLRLLDKELAFEEQLINRLFNRHIIMEAAFLPDMVDKLLDGEISGFEEYPFRKLNRIWVAPFYVMLMDIKSFSNRTFAHFVLNTMDNSLDYWQLPRAIKLRWTDVKNRFPSPLSGMFLSCLDSMLVQKYKIIFEIRAMRLLLREKAGMPTNDLHDPFTDAPLKVIKGQFNWGKTRGFLEKKVCGVRIYSVGRNGIDNNGISGGIGKDDVTFDIVTELVE